MVVNNGFLIQWVPELINNNTTNYPISFTSFVRPVTSEIMVWADNEGKKVVLTCNLSNVYTSNYNANMQGIWFLGS